MKYIIGIIIIAALASDSSGLTGEPDLIGVYFDEACELTSWTTTEPNEYVHFWVAVKNMSATADFATIIFRLVLNDTGFTANSLIGGQNPDDDGVYILAASPFIPPSDLILVCHGGLFIDATSGPMRFWICPVPLMEVPSPSYRATDFQDYPLTPSSLSIEVPVAVINPNLVPTESGSWGQIKRLYL